MGLQPPSLPLPPWLSKKPGPGSAGARWLLGSIGKLVLGQVPVPELSQACGRAAQSMASTHELCEPGLCIFTEWGLALCAGEYIFNEDLKDFTETKSRGSV